MSTEVATLHATISAETDRAIRNLQRFKQALEDGGSASNKLGTQIESNAKKAEKATASMTSAFRQGGIALAAFAATAVIGFQQIKQGAASLDIQTSLNRRLNESGISLVDFRGRMREASAGTVNDFTLMQNASKAMAYGITTDVTRLADLMTVVRFRAREAGLSTEEGFRRAVEHSRFLI